MAVHSNTFGGLRLSGDDAKKFRNQVRFGSPSKAAKRSAESGVILAKELVKSGQVKVDKD